MAPVIIFGLLLGTFVGVEGKFKSLHCTVHDKDYAEIPVCKLNPINKFRNSVDVLFKQKKATNEAMVRMETFKKGKVWLPYIYNSTLKMCDLLKKNKNFVFTRAFSFVKPYLTITNFCPWKENSTIKCTNFELDLDGLRNRFPLEKGEYAVEITILYENIRKVSINGSVNYSDYKDVWKKTKN